MWLAATIESDVDEKGNVCVRVEDSLIQNDIRNDTNDTKQLRVINLKKAGLDSLPLQVRLICILKCILQTYMYINMHITDIHVCYRHVCKHARCRHTYM